MTTKPHYLAIAVRAAIVLALVPTAYAQDDATTEAAEAITLDTIKVTARKREETLLEVPLAITAFSSDRIEKLGLESISDIALVTPGFSFRSNFGRNADRPVIRGQSNIQGESNSAFFIDGVFVNGNISGYGLDNLERVEIIRGPQAAQFGRRAFSGAINYVTRRPTNEPQANVSATAATDSEREYSANISGAFVPDVLKFQFNARYYQFGGQYENYTNGIKDLGGQRTTSAGGTLYLTPTDAWESTLRMNYSEDEDEHFVIGRTGDPENLRRNGIVVNNSVDYLNNVLNCFKPTFTGTNSNGFLAGPRPNTSTRTRGQICGEVDIPRAFGVNTDRLRAAGFQPGIDRESTRYSWANDFTTDSGWTFNSTTAYNEVKSLIVADQDYSSLTSFPFPFSATGAFETVDFGVGKDYSQEFRLSTPVDNALRGSVGYYYYREVGEPGFSANMSTFRAATATTAAILPTRNPTRPAGAIINTAIFGMIEYDWNDALTTTAELRVAEDRIDFAGTSSFRFRPIGTPQSVPETIAERTFNKSGSFDNILPRLTVKYDLNDSMNVYALAAKGNKPGGFNAIAESAALTNEARATFFALGLDQFDEESAWTYELGFKGGLLDDALNVSAALYFIDWQNQQLTSSRSFELISGVQQLNSLTESVGESSVNGLELEADYRLTDALSLRATYAYTKTEIDSFFNQDIADLTNCGAASAATGCGSAAGKELPRVPKNQASLTANWESTFANGMGYFVRTVGSFEGSRFTQIENTSRTGSSFNLGIRAGVNLDKNLSLTAFVRNATDDATPEDIIRFINPSFGICRPPIAGESVSTAICSGGLNGTNVRDLGVSAPRMRQYGVTVNYKF